MDKTKSWLFSFVFCLGFFALEAQVPQPDCITAHVICSGESIEQWPEGSGFVQDFANTNNFGGCASAYTEDNASWFVFGIQDDAPPGLILTFEMLPQTNEWYGFVIWGSENIHCDSLGVPIRCLNKQTTGTPIGLRMDEPDYPNDHNSNGWLAPLEVNPGDIYYLMIDNTLISLSGFTLTWGGSAVPYLDCDAGCRLTATHENISTCAGAQDILLNPEINYPFGDVTYQWSSEYPDFDQIIDDSSIKNPVLSFPHNWSDTIEIELMVADEKCTEFISFNIVPRLQEFPTLSLTQCGESDGSAYFDLTMLETQLCSGSCDFIRWYVDDSLKTNIDFSDNYRTKAPHVYAQVFDEFCSIGYPAIEVSLNILPAPNVAIAEMNPFCALDTFFLSSTTNSRSFKHAWSGPSDFTSSENKPFIPSASEINEGWYFLTVTEPLNQCTIIDSTEVVMNHMDDVALEMNSELCQGETLHGQITGGEYFTWIKNGVVINSTSSLQIDEVTSADSGLYQLIVENEFGCKKEITSDVEVLTHDQVSMSHDMELCRGEDAILEVKDAVDAYWIMPDESLISSSFYELTNVSEQDAGEYIAVVTSQNSCVKEYPVQVDVVDKKEIHIVGQETYCAGEKIELTTAIEEVVTWTLPNYSNVNETQLVIEDAQENQSGWYKVSSLANSESCSAVDSIFISISPTPEINIETKTDACLGETISFSATTDGTEYSWSGPNQFYSEELNFELDAAEIHAGTYTFSVRSEHGCKNEISQELQVHKNPNVELKKRDVICFGEESGRLEVINLDQDQTIEVDWGNGFENHVKRVFLSAGEYNLKIRNEHQCTVEKASRIEEPRALDVLAEVLKKPSTGIAEDGEMRVQISGGVLPYKMNYALQGAATNTIDGEENVVLDELKSGNYFLTISDANLCQYEIEVLVEPSCADMIKVSKEDISCFGYNDGKIILTTNYSEDDFQISWSNSTEKPWVRSNLSSGNYALHAIHVPYQCEFDFNIEIEEPEKLVVEYDLFQALCPQEESMLFDINIKGGVNPYEVVLDDEEIEMSEHILTTGQHELFILDQNQCHILQDIEIAEVTSAESDLVQDQYYVKEGQEITLAIQDENPISEVRISHINTENEDFDVNRLICSDCAQVTFTPEVSGEYTLTYKTEKGCEETWVISVFVGRSVYIPNAFNPNSTEPEHQSLKIYTSNTNDRLIAFKVFNKWGGVVYQEENIPLQNMLGWTGHQNGEQFPQQTYRYWAKIQLEGEAKPRLISGVFNLME